MRTSDFPDSLSRPCLRYIVLVGADSGFVAARLLARWSTVAVDSADMTEEGKATMEERSIVNERRLNMHLMAHWQEQRGKRDFVSPQDFDPTPLGDIWSDCFMVNAVERRNEMIFEHLGRKIALASKVPADLWNASEVPEKTLLATVLDTVPEVLTGHQPIVSGGEFEDFLGRRCLFRGILLPLGEDRQTPQCLVGGARCKVVVRDG